MSHEEVQSPESLSVKAGDSVSISCTGTSGVDDDMSWYLQKPGEAPELLIYKANRLHFLVILIFIKSTADCIAHSSSLHILLLILFYCFYLLSFFLILFLPIFKYMLLCYVSSFIYFIFFALSIERTCPDLHFTTDYTLYDCVCDK